MDWGKLKDYHFKINLEILPVTQLGVIERVREPAQWVNPLVTVEKRPEDNRKCEVRICVDMGRANETIVQERHP